MWLLAQTLLTLIVVQIQMDPPFIRRRTLVAQIFDLRLFIFEHWQMPGTTYQTGADVVLRAQFINNGKLSNTFDTNFRAISNNWPVFGLVHDLGTITASKAPAVFSIGHVRDPAIRYIVANNNLQNRSLHFWSDFPSIPALVSVLC